MENEPKKDKNFIELTPHLYNCCLEYMSRRKYTGKTGLLYTSVLDKVFKHRLLTQTLYNEVYASGNYSKSVLRLISKVCEHFDIPGHKYKVIKPISRERGKPQVWTDEDIKKMIDNVEEYGLLISCAYNIGAGLRFSSALMLAWDDFHWEHWLQDKTKTGKCDITAKGNKTATLYVNSILMNKLYDIAVQSGKTFQGIPYKNSSDNNYLFIKKIDMEALESVFRKQNFENILDSNNKRINVKEMARIEMIRKKHYLVDYRLRKISKMFNVKHIKFHSIRHSAATNMLKKGYRLLTIKEQLMHKSISTTEIYLSLGDKDIEDEFNEKR